MSRGGGVWGPQVVVVMVWVGIMQPVGQVGHSEAILVYVRPRKQQASLNDRPFSVCVDDEVCLQEAGGLTDAQNRLKFDLHDLRTGHDWRWCAVQRAASSYACL